MSKAVSVWRMFVGVCAGIGIQSGLKIRRRKRYASSSLARRTTKAAALSCCHRFIRRCSLSDTPTTKTSVTGFENLVALNVTDTSVVTGIPVARLKIWLEWFHFQNPTPPNRSDMRHTNPTFGVGQLCQLRNTVLLLNNNVCITQIVGVGQQLGIWSQTQHVSSPRFLAVTPNGGFYTLSEIPTHTTNLFIIDRQETLEWVKHRLQTLYDTPRSPKNVGQVTPDLYNTNITVFAGTRTPVAAVQRYLLRGIPANEILVAYPHLQHSDIETAKTHLMASLLSNPDPLL